MTGDTLTADTVAADTTPVDTMEALISERPMPKSADELFDDFIFNFAANKRLQSRRIVFPLPVREGEITMSIEEDDWEMERFFMQQGYYTIILESRGQLELSKDTSVCNVVVEKMDMANDRVKMYNFERLAGQWHLTWIEYHQLKDNANADFLMFYERFATDSVEFVNSLNDPVHFTGPDPEDEFSDISADISPGEWKELGLDDLPSGLIYNILYGQKYTRDDIRVLIIRGIANGLEAELTFMLVSGTWKLVQVCV